MDKPILFLMVGLPCSGKSVKSQELAEEHNATIFSSDALREELFNDVNHQEDNAKLFNELHRRIKECLKEGNHAIYDATNINYKRRMAFLSELKNIPCKKICVLMATPFDVCLNRNNKRDRKVPEHVINRMYLNFDIPWYYEGWDEIEVEYADGVENLYGWPYDFIESTMYFDQENSHHDLTLGEHCAKTTTYVNQCLVNRIGVTCTTELKYAAMLHDNGKPYTKTFTNGKGEVTEQAHYYNHERVGSYDSLFYEMPCNKLYVATLIRWHMMPYFYEKDNNESLHNKYKKLWGEDLYNSIMLLHKADKAAH